MGVERELGELRVGGARLVAIPRGPLAILEPGDDLEAAARLDRVRPAADDLRVLNGESGDCVGTLSLASFDERLGTCCDRGVEHTSGRVGGVHGVLAAIEQAGAKLAFGELLCEIASRALLRVIAELSHGLETKSEGPHPDG